MISVESTDDTIHVRIPRGAVTEERLSEILRLLRWEEAVATSKMTEEEADAMAEEMKKDWWERNKDRFIPPTFAATE